MNWDRALLGQVTENYDSLRVPVKEPNRRPGPYPYYGASGIVDSVDRYIFDGEYLLVAEDGENLRTRKSPVAFLAAGRFWVNNHAHIIRGNACADTRYLMYALSQVNIGAFLSGSTMPKLTQANLNRIPIPMPPLSVQRAIAAILGALDDKIELNRRMNRTLEAMAQALFQSWFVDFDPVRAKMAGRRPAGMDAETAALFPTSFAENSDGAIPDGWSLAPLSDLATINREQVNPSAYDGEVFDHFSIPAFDDGAMPRAELGRQIKSAKFTVVPDAVLLSKLNPRIPRVWLPNVDGIRRSVCSTEFLVLQPNPSVSRAYLYGLLQSHGFVEKIATMVTGTSGSHQRVQPEHVLALEAMLPPCQIIQHYSRVVDPLLSRIALDRAESATLRATRDALLPKLLSGELRVPEAGRLVEAIL